MIIYMIVIPKHSSFKMEKNHSVFIFYHYNIK